MTHLLKDKYERSKKFFYDSLQKNKVTKDSQKNMDKSMQKFFKETEKFQSDVIFSFIDQ